MYRLKYFLLQMDQNESRFDEIYEGKQILNFPLKSNGETIPPEIVYSSTYWYNDISFVFSRTHKLALDKPTVEIRIPAGHLGINKPQSVVADYCLRKFINYIEKLNQDLYNRSRPDWENGKYYIYNPGSEILLRNATYFSYCPQKDYINGKANVIYQLEDYGTKPLLMCLCIRIQIQLPHRKLKKIIKMLCKDLPETVERFIIEFNPDEYVEAVNLNNKQAEIRKWLSESEYCAFIANGSILPREGNSSRPLKDARPFYSPPEDEIEICGILGMGIRRGITVITGGGYSGKSTVLDAIASGIYDHVQGDGRELCITDSSAVSICAEDGRSINNIDISPFIKWIPEKDTKNFTTKKASGSTSQAANVIEAMEVGAKLFLVDEDKSAANFMVKDKIMSDIITDEPVIPFTHRVRELYEKNGVSTIFVIGSSSEYIPVSDHIYIMEHYNIRNITSDVKQLACSYQDKNVYTKTNAQINFRRLLNTEKFSPYPDKCGVEYLEISDLGYIMIGNEKINIQTIENLVSSAQANAIGFMIRYLEITSNDESLDIDDSIDSLYSRIYKEGLDIVYSSIFVKCGRFMELPRKCELRLVINRMKNICFKN